MELEDKGGVPRCIMLGMQWRADRTTISAAIALVVGGFARIVFFHDPVLGGAAIGLGVLIAVRTFFYFRKLDAERPTHREKSN